jgi:hypothetical protein
MTKATNIDPDMFGMRPVRAFLICEDLPQVDDINKLPRSMEVFLNPRSINFNAEGVWADIDVPGLSHQVHQYSHSKSNIVSFTLVWDRILAERRLNHRNRLNLNTGLADSYLRSIHSQTLIDPYQYKDFLLGLTVPMVPGYAPSRVTFIWPKFLHMTGIVKPVNFKFTRFTASGAVMAFRADIRMTELRINFRQRVEAEKFFWDPTGGATQATREIGNNKSDFEFTLGESEGVDYSFTYEEVYGSNG